MRWLGGSALLILAVLLWLASILADPYTAWGGGPEQVRPGPARVSVNLALASLALAGASAWLVYRDPGNRRGWAAWLFAVALAALAAADLWRAIWIWFVVLA